MMFHWLTTQCQPPTFSELRQCARRAGIADLCLLAVLGAVALGEPCMAAALTLIAETGTRLAAPANLVCAGA